MSWFYRLNEDPEFRAAVAARWNEVSAALHTSDAYLAGYEDRVANSATDNFVLWWGDSSSVARSEWQAEVDYLRDWLSTRIDWMDGQF